MLLYHLDRGHSLKEGMQINLKNGSQALSNVENSHFISLFTDGFSFFGLDILCNSNFAHGKHPVCLDKSA